MTRLILMEGPAAAPVTLEDFRDHVRVEHRDEDMLIQSYLDSAASLMDGPSGILGRCMVSQKWRQDFAGWSARLALRLPDVSAAEVTYTDAAGAELIVDPADYEIVEDIGGAVLVFTPGFAFPTLGVSARPLRVTMTAGYGAPRDVPFALRQALMMLAAHWRSTREAVLVGVSVASVPLGFEALIAPFRRITV